MEGYKYKRVYVTLEITTKKKPLYNRYTKYKQKKPKANHYKKIIKEQRKTAREEERDKTTAKQKGNNLKYDNSKFSLIIKYLKCKCIKLTNQKSQSD